MYTNILVPKNSLAGNFQKVRRTLIYLRILNVLNCFVLKFEKNVFHSKDYSTTILLKYEITFIDIILLYMHLKKNILRIILKIIFNFKIIFKFKSIWKHFMFLLIIMLTWFQSLPIYLSKIVTSYKILHRILLQHYFTLNLEIKRKKKYILSIIYKNMNTN